MHLGGIRIVWQTLARLPSHLRELLLQRPAIVELSRQGIHRDVELGNPGGIFSGGGANGQVCHLECVIGPSRREQAEDLGRELRIDHRILRIIVWVACRWG